MKTVILISLVAILSGCATTHLQKIQNQTLDCVDRYVDKGANPRDAFEVCRQIYGVRLIKE